MEGQILGNRYELLEKIGGGGMAQVYRAKCKLLNRFVAVKVLRNDFSNDEEFIRRFRIEAQAAASLSHPNIVSIYDVGLEKDIHYIVMEYVDGITLKDYITRKGSIEWKEAVGIARQMCSAIDHAHKNKIVHRDIKPHNILYTSEGIIKVTDFGIARAASFSTITMVGSTIGSVHYFSPEQARGGYTDEKSDLYSLGMVLYEMVTGKLPFDGETPVAIALKHIQTEPQEPIQINSKIPTGLNSIILNAIKKEQSLRYQTAAELLADLNRVLKEPDSNYKRYTEEDVASTRRMQAVDAKILNADAERKMKPASEEKTPDQKRRDRMTILLTIISGFLIIPVIAFVSWKLVVPMLLGSPAPEFEFRDYKGGYYPQIRDQLVQKGIDVVEVRKFDTKFPKDTIISQNRQAGEKVKLDRFKPSITFEVSSGTEKVKIPDLRTLDYRVAEAKIRDLGLIADIQEEFHDTVAKEIVIRTEPIAEIEVDPKAVVKIFQSKGPQNKETLVPYLLGKKREEALKLLSEAKLALGKLAPENSSNITDKIIQQFPEANTRVKEGTPVDLTFEVPVAAEEKKLTRITIPLTSPDRYSDTIQVTIEVIPQGKNPEKVYDEVKKKTEFPLPVSFEVPANENARIKVFLDRVLYSEY